MGVVSARQVLWQGYGWHKLKCNESALELVPQFNSLQCLWRPMRVFQPPWRTFGDHQPLMTAPAVRRTGHIDGAVRAAICHEAYITMS